MQFLFGLEFTQYEYGQVLEEFWEIHTARPSVRHYATKLIEGVCQHRDELDTVITESLHNWSPERVGRVERSILRIALYEMLHMPDVPDVVAINEALEVARQYGDDEMPKFINGVLDRARANKQDTASREG